MTALPMLLLCLAACDGSEPLVQRQAKKPAFPAADRPVAGIVSTRWSTEEARDRVNEAGRVMELADIKAGMTVADIGAGEGYYAVRLAKAVGAEGRVVAEDIMPEARDQLAAAHESLAQLEARALALG